MVILGIIDAVVSSSLEEGESFVRVSVVSSESSCEESLETQKVVEEISCLVWCSSSGIVSDVWVFSDVALLVVSAPLLVSLRCTVPAD